MGERKRWRPRTIRARVALWTCAAMALAMLVFALVAGIVVWFEEKDEHPDETDVISDTTEQVLVALGIAAPIGLALVAGGALWITRRALSPIDRVIRVAGEVTPSHLDRRIPLPERDDELRALAVTLNGLLERLEQGYASLDAFAADASHELRTPLAVIATSLEVSLRKPRSPEEWEQVARTALDEIARLGRLTDALLRIARADGTGGAKMERVEIGTIVDQVVAGQAAAAQAKGVDLSGATAGAAFVNGDADALLSAVTNVVSNAIAYTPKEGTIHVAAAHDGGRVSLTVEDSGPGLAPGELESIFTPFARGVEGKRAREGFGLGLPIARRIAQRHGGTVTAANRVGGGARFVIELPEQASDLGPQASARSRSGSDPAEA